MEIRYFYIALSVLHLSLFVVPRALAQSDDVVQRIVSQLTDEDGVDNEEYAFFLYALMDNPWDINTVTSENLSQFTFLSAYQVANILHFRDRIGGYKTVSELLLVDGVTETVYCFLKHFVYADLQAPLSGVKHRTPIKGEWFTRGITQLPRAEGFVRYPDIEMEKEKESVRRRYAETRFDGIPYAFSSKLRVQKGTRWDVGITVDQDAGEQWGGKGRPFGIDYINGYVHFKSKNLSVLAGSYTLAWGYGLMLCNQFSLGSSYNEALTMGNGINPHRSWREADYFRGIALRYSPIRNIGIELFGSYNRWDGRYYPGLLNNTDTLLFATVSTDGLHRNQRETNIRRKVDEVSAGARVEWNGKLVRLGVMGMGYHFTPGLYRFPSRIYTHWEDNGRKRMLYGGYFGLSLGRFATSGEAVFSTSGSELDILRSDMAIMLNLLYRGDRWSVLLAGRHFGKAYNARFSSSHSAYSGVGNEQGVLGQWDWNPGRNKTLRLRGDVFTPLRSRYRITQPLWGYDTRAEWTMGRNKHTYMARIRMWGKPEDEGKENTVLKHRQEYSMRYRCDSLSDFAIQLQVSAVRYSKAESKEWGSAIALRGYYTGKWCTVSASVAYGRTDSYNSRIYLSAPIIRYGYSSVLVYEQTFNTCMNVTYKLNKHLELQGRTELVVYPGKSTIGSDVDAITGNKKCRLTAQIIYKW